MKLYYLPVIFIISCTSNGKPIREMPIVMPPPAVTTAQQPQPVNQNPEVKEIHSLIESGTYSDLKKALELITSYDIAKTEFGRLMAAVAITLLNDVYSETGLPRPDPPQTETYSKILSAAAQGNYLAPASGCTDYLELTLPFLALLDADSQNSGLPGIVRQNSKTAADPKTSRINSAVIGNLQKAVSINPDGIIAIYFLGLAYEKTGNTKEATDLYAKSLKIDAEFFPAMLGKARIMHSNAQDDSVIEMFTELERIYPDNMMRI
jgi:tetratricopeptide (TPR) repeat protein